MIAAQFDYVAARSLDEAVKLLAQHKDQAKLLAGGHSLIPAMKLRLAQPKVLVDISRIRDLAYIRQRDGELRIGAMTTHYQIESEGELRSVCRLLPETATQIGDVQVRNKGTLGGSLAHADPAADWPATMIALGANLVTVSPRGERTIAAQDFFLDLLTTALKPDEILREIRIQLPKGRSGQAYLKMRQPASGFAVVGVAVALEVEGGRCARAAVGITGVGSKAYRATAVENGLAGKPVDQATAEAAATHAADKVEANADLYASAEFRKHLAQVYTRRAILTAAGRAR